ncbi:unnamed protein product [Gemmata massiliana]|uniref:Uncharacterized protein n=1 Tax=Gemmata massiliana TaxID=1210884 RepID=A0A6P2D273_9BACT|nr:unnamed protein product [Gemmata massiliana]
MSENGAWVLFFLMLFALVAFWKACDTLVKIKRGY